MAFISVKSNTAQVTAVIRRDASAVPFAVVKALTRTGQAIKRAEEDEMRRVFDRPTPYTLRSLFLQPATKATPVARVWIKDDRAGSGTPAEKFLAPSIEGGTRSRRASERYLQQLLAMPQGWYIVPGRAAKIDGYGNWAVGEIKQILSYFQAAGLTAGSSANTTPEGRRKLKKGTRRRRGIEYFTVLPNSRAARHLRPGIYRKTFFAFGGAIKPIAIFVQTVTYGRRFPFFEVAERVASSQFSVELQRAFAEESR